MGTDWNAWFGREHPPALKKVTLLECIWTDCPVDVQDEAREIWHNMGFGNDYYYYVWDKDSIKSYPIIAQYLKEKGIPEDEEVLIHFWW